MEPIAENAVDKREEIKNKLRESFDGKIVRKDLTKKIKEGAKTCRCMCWSSFLVSIAVPMMSLSLSRGYRM